MTALRPFMEAQTGIALKITALCESLWKTHFGKSRLGDTQERTPGAAEWTTTQLSKRLGAKRTRVLTQLRRPPTQLRTGSFPGCLRGATFQNWFSTEVRKALCIMLGMI